MDPQHDKNTVKADRLPATAFLAKSLGDENRLRILLFIADGKQSVSRIVEAMGLSQPLVSHHLKELRRALLVRVERQGPFVLYEVADKKIVTIIRELNTLASALIAGRQNF